MKFSSTCFRRIFIVAVDFAVFNRELAVQDAEALHLFEWRQLLIDPAHDGLYRGQHRSSCSGAPSSFTPLDLFPCG